MNPFIWCAVGAIIGAIAGVVMRTNGVVSKLENVLVAIFGSFAGGDFLASLVSGGTTTDTKFTGSALGMAVAGALVMLALLAGMRSIIGPLRPHKIRKKPRP